ncbi:MAG: hypothetical protein M1828_004446 [Chrysothrix sp. TS-e1954]|nr:MAG: hypothetical protein M1828_004446 [Chrysothrix sp. TS-e1954]
MSVAVADNGPTAGDSEAVPASLHQTNGSRPSDERYADTAIASSPVLRDVQSSPIQTLERQRDSQLLTARLKRDLENSRSASSEPRDDDSFIRDDDSGLGQVSDAEDANQDAKPVEKHGSPRTAEEIEAVNYSTLSKRADYILANAKKKLDLLEGNLGRARHSLLYSPTGSGELRTSSSLSSHSPLHSPGAEDRRMRLGPRINFAPSRDGGGATVTRRATTGHNRMFSDTSVPSPRGAAIKGSRSLHYVRNDTEVERRRFRKNSAKGSEPDAPLEEVSERPESRSAGSIDAIRELYGMSPPTETKTTKDLRDEAGDLRKRISFLQQHPPGTGSRRNSILANSPALEQEEETFKSEVQQLEQHLEHQEEVIEQLEEAERRGSIVPDPRAEWHQVLDYNDHSDGSDFSEGEYDDVDSVEYENVLAGAEEDTAATDGAHEDRSDAFDYEHFILHSGMGSYNMMAPEEASSSPVSSTASTTRGYPADEDNNEGTLRSITGNASAHGTNASVNSLTSYETAAEPSDSGSDSGSYASLTKGGNDVEGDVQDVWPMPPASRSSSRRPRSSKTPRRESSMQTPTQRDFPAPAEDNLVQLDLAQRPVSTIYAALTAREEASQQPTELDEKDLIRTTVESLRTVCLTLRDAGSDAREKRYMRERLEVARRVLDGEL